MEFDRKNPPRKFSPLSGITLLDTGRLHLSADEQITLVDDSGKCNDILRKDWGYYLTNSINANLSSQGYKVALVISNASNPSRLYLNLVDIDKLELFYDYMEKFDASLVCWLDEWGE